MRCFLLFAYFFQAKRRDKMADVMTRKQSCLMALLLLLVAVVAPVARARYVAVTKLQLIDEQDLKHFYDKTPPPAAEEGEGGEGGGVLATRLVPSRVQVESHDGSVHSFTGLVPKLVHHHRQHSQQRQEVVSQEPEPDAGLERAEEDKSAVDAEQLQAMALENARQLDYLLVLEPVQHHGTLVYRPLRLRLAQGSVSATEEEAAAAVEEATTTTSTTTVATTTATEAATTSSTTSPTTTSTTEVASSTTTTTTTEAVAEDDDDEEEAPDMFVTEWSTVTTLLEPVTTPGADAAVFRRDLADQKENLASGVMRQAIDEYRVPQEPDMDTVVGQMLNVFDRLWRQHQDTAGTTTATTSATSTTARDEESEEEEEETAPRDPRDLKVAQPRPLVTSRVKQVAEQQPPSYFRRPDKCGRDPDDAPAVS
ncbi:hypothetical protein HDE_09074 [Halotydeus destructor]|nr:hypothetical protein HDE_09074 [Halotydeus destructor]